MNVVLTLQLFITLCHFGSPIPVRDGAWMSDRLPVRDILVLEVTGHFALGDRLRLTFVGEQDSLTTIELRSVSQVSGSHLKPNRWLPPARFWETEHIADLDGDGFDDLKLTAYLPASGLAASRQYVLFIFPSGTKTHAVSFEDFSEAFPGGDGTPKDLDRDGIAEVTACDVADWSNQDDWFREFACNVYNFANGSMVNVSTAHGFPLLIKFDISGEVSRRSDERYIRDLPEGYSYFSPARD